MSKRVLIAVMTGVVCMLARPPGSQAAVLTVLPPAHRFELDSTTGVHYTVLADSGKSANLYFHQRSWLSDNSVVLYTGPTSAQRLMGYIQATGERIVIGNITGATAAARRNSVFGMRDRKLVEIALLITISNDPRSVPSRVEATERTIRTLTFTSQVNANYDDTFLSVYENNESITPKRYSVYRISVSNGEMIEVCRASSSISHLQWSRGPSNLLMYSGNDDARLWVVNPAEGVPRNVYVQVPSMGEWVTHESWWVNDQILWCGAPWPAGYELDPQRGEYHHVNVLDLHSGISRIVAAGSWLPAQENSERWKRNFHHACGDEDGRWIVADSFSGVLTLTEGKTTRTRLFTVGHRTYGGGEHSHPSFDRLGKQVVFVTNRFGEPRVCVARIPDDWRAESAPIITSVEPAAEPPQRPGDLPFSIPALFPSEPNPFNPATLIRFSVPRTERVVLSIYAINGQLVCTLVDATRQGGEHSARWEGRDSRGRLVGAGVYLCRLVTPSGTATERIVVVR
ncbi:MAG TPA: T9SS type A sorting domain-containing protein [Candidatus Latescibacteria bacterium]|nr:T9SS type A sorting domain-containing protein [Candidatus Latescibacterota bacterium]